MQAKVTRTDESYIYTTARERASVSCPAQPVLLDPGIKVVFGLLSETKGGRCDALQNIVVVLRRPEDGGRRVWNVPEPAQRLMISKDTSAQIAYQARSINEKDEIAGLALTLTKSKDSNRMITKTFSR